MTPQEELDTIQSIMFWDEPTLDEMTKLEAAELDLIRRIEDGE